MDDGYGGSNPLFKLTTCVEMITHDLAREYLKKTVKNRKISKRHVDFLARQMRVGKWRGSPQPIVFDIHGNLIDGQHRLKAIIVSDVTIPALVVRGAEPDSFDALDLGRRRTAGSILAIKGEKNGNMLAGAAVAMWRYKKGDKFFDEAGQYPSTPEILDTVENNPDLRLGVAVVQGIEHISRPSIVAFLYVEFFRRNRDMASWFFECMKDGWKPDTRVTHLSGRGITQLRDRLRDNWRSTAKLPAIGVAGLIVKTWNAYREGKEVRKLQLLTKGSPFPEIV